MHLSGGEHHFFVCDHRSFPTGIVSAACPISPGHCCMTVSTGRTGMAPMGKSAPGGAYNAIRAEWPPHWFRPVFLISRHQNWVPNPATLTSRGKYFDQLLMAKRSVIDPEPSANIFVAAQAEGQGRSPISVDLGNGWREATANSPKTTCVWVLSCYRA